MNHSRNHAVKVLAFFETSFKMIDELMGSFSINSEYARFNQQDALKFLANQEKLKQTIPAEMNYCLDLVIAEVNSIFIPSITELEVLDDIIKKFPALERNLKGNIKTKKSKHAQLTEILNKSEIGLSNEIRKSFIDLQERYDNQTKRIKLTFGLI